MPKWGESSPWIQHKQKRLKKCSQGHELEAVYFGGVYMCKHKSKVNREDKCNIHRRKVFSLMNRKHSRNARKLIQNWRLITYKNFLRRGEVGDELKLPAMTHSSEDSPEVAALNKKLMQILKQGRVSRKLNHI